MGGKGSGGARLRSGPAPDPNALRRERDAKDWIKLPSEGRTGDIPEWPVELPSPTVAELSMWSRLWRLPQALVWEADRGHDMVALYVRTFCDSVVKDAPAARTTQAKQLAEALLLTTPALHAARYTIASPVAPEAPRVEDSMSRHPSSQPRKASGARALLKVVEPEPDGGDE